MKLSFAVVEPDTSLTITSSDTTVWPDGLEKGTPSWFSTSFADPFVHEIGIRLFDGCAPIAGQLITVTADWVYASGGHLHEMSSDSFPSLDTIGEFSVIDSTHTGDGSIVTSTGADGKIHLTYQAPRYGGLVNIRAETLLAGDTLVNASQLTIRVPDLVLLPTSGPDYVKIGGTADHPGPPGYAEDLNHWGRQETIDSLLAVNEEWTVPGESPLYINDMSLPSGGLFDVAGRWTTNHKQHRVGRDVDLRTRRAGDDVSRIGIQVGDLPGRVRSRKFENLALSHGAHPIPDVHCANSPPGCHEHYHVFFYPK